MHLFTVLSQGVLISSIKPISSSICESAKQQGHKPVVTERLSADLHISEDRKTSFCRFRPQQTICLKINLGARSSG